MGDTPFLPLALTYGGGVGFFLSCVVRLHVKLLSLLSRALGSP
jgi:hypothetical protein